MREIRESPSSGGVSHALDIDEGGVRISGGALHLGQGREPIPLADVVSAEETTPPKSASQILTMMLGCLILLVAVPSAMMCPLALMGIPLAAKVLSKALHDQENSFALRVVARGRAPVVVRFDERRHGARVEEALLRVLQDRL